VFLSVLEQSGNARAVEIVTSRSDGARSYSNLVESIFTKSSVGSFEGYLHQDELEAKMIVELNSNDLKPKGLLDVARSLFKSDRASSDITLKRKERLD